MREKVKRKVSESHRKKKKAAKKDVTWKSNKPKEVAIPSKFPFKDQLLAEAAAEKARVEEERLASREAQRAGVTSGATLASTAAVAAAMAADSQRAEYEMEDLSTDDEEDKVADASLKLHAKSLRKVLEASDVVVEVLDARDPVGTRCRAVEKELKSLDGGRKKLVLVLNKIDLVPPPVVKAWLAHLRLQTPTIAFKCSTQQQRNNLSASSKNVPHSASGASTKPLMELIKGFRVSSGPTSGDQKAKTSLTIGLIGHPNVGKSSLINTLKRSKACSVAPTPGWTKEVQEVVLEKGVRVLDCPGVVVEARGQIEGALRGMVKPEEVRDPRAAVEMILGRCKREHLMMLYNIPAFSGLVEFLVEVAKGKGRLKKGGVPDLDGTARSILRDWVSGRIPYYTSPPNPTPAAVPGAQDTPATLSADDLDSASLMTAFAPAFDLAALFGDADMAAFGDLPSDAPGLTKGVRMVGFEGDSEDANVGWVTGGDDSDIEADATMDDDEEDDDLNVDDLVEDDEFQDLDDESEEGEDTLVSSISLPSTSTNQMKRKGSVNIVSVAPSGKKGKSVSFASKALGPTAGTVNSPSTSAISQKAKIFAEVEAPVALNKSIKQLAKKNKKQAAKAAKAVKEVEMDFGEDAEMPTKPRPAQTLKGMDVDVDEAYSFEEFFPSTNIKANANGVAH